MRGVGARARDAFHRVRNEAHLVRLHDRDSVTSRVQFGCHVLIQSALLVIEKGEVDTESAFTGDFGHIDIVGNFAAKVIVLVSPLRAVFKLDIVEPSTIVFSHLKIILLSLKILAIQAFDPELPHIKHICSI